MGPCLLTIVVESIFTVCIFIVSSHCASSCLFRRFRDTYDYIADCHNSNLTKVPRKPYNGPIRVLHLQYNKIATIRSRDFIDYHELERVSLRANLIRSIQDGAFKDLSRLRKLDLSKNYLRVIEPNSWVRMSTSLSRLSLDSNLLAHFPNVSAMSKLKHLNLSYNDQIREIDSRLLPRSLLELDLRFTGITHFTQSSFKNLHKMKALYLSDNLASSFVTFEPAVFDDFTSLRHLDLSRTFCKTLPVDSFRHMKNLRTLSMRNCWLNATPLFAPVGANGSRPKFYTPSLTEVDLSYNRRMVIHENLSAFPTSLVFLSLAKTRLSMLSSDLFRNLTKLRHLDITHSKVANISADAFRDLSSVAHLKLSRNPFQSAPTLPATLRAVDVTGTKLKRITRNMTKQLEYATDANFSHNEIEDVQDHGFGTMVALQILDLSDNRLGAVKKNFFSLKTHLDPNCEPASQNGSSHKSGSDGKPGLRSMGKLEKLKKCAAEKTMSEGGLINLRVLNLRSNRIAYIHEEAFRGFDKIEILDLGENLLRAVDYRVLHYLKSLLELRLDANELTHLGTIKLPHLQTLDVSFNRLRRFPDWKENRVKVLKASRNQFRNITAGSLKGAERLEEIDLSLNEISQIDYSSFQDSPLLRLIDLDDNSVDKFLDVRIPNLQVLSISNNHIDKIDRPFEQVAPLLHTLKMENNNLSFVNPEVFDGVFSLRVVDFSHNMFNCDCSLKPFAEWMGQNEDLVQDAYSYQCNRPGTVMFTLNGDMDCEETGQAENDASEDDDDDDEDEEEDSCICIDPEM